MTDTIQPMTFHNGDHSMCRQTIFNLWLLTWGFFGKANGIDDGFLRICFLPTPSVYCGWSWSIGPLVGDKHSLPWPYRNNCYDTECASRDTTHLHENLYLYRATFSERLAKEPRISYWQFAIHGAGGHLVKKHCVHKTMMSGGSSLRIYVSSHLANLRHHP